MAPTTPQYIRLGVIVPSSNTVLEPLTQQIISDIPPMLANVSVHFARFRVTTISLSNESNSQFALQPMLEAAMLLADAKVHMIGWSGTSAAWLGLSNDEILCKKIQEVTGIPATSSVLAMKHLLTARSLSSLGLITPYLPNVNTAIRRSLEAEGFSITEKRSWCSGLSHNFDFAAVGEQELDNMVTEVVSEGAKTVLVVCTNLRAADRVAHWEEIHSIVVVDSVSTVVYGMLGELGIDSSALSERWGSMFDRK